MKPRLLSARPSVTRTSRHDPRGVALESVAAEFALLAQRRARIARQLDLLGRQLAAAQSSLDAVQSRMAMLAQRMDGIDPTLRPALPAPPPAPDPPQRAAIPHLAGPALQGNGRVPATTQRVPPLKMSLRQAPRRRPFLPD
jgi:uncharacterized coiled-coil protein SlyX